MLRISARKTRIQAETDARYRGRPLVVVLNGHECFVREKGRRTAYAVPFLAIYELGMKLAANEQRRLKAERRKGRP